MRRIGGRCQRGVRRCLRANGEATTAQIMAWAYRRPAETRRQRQRRAQAVRYAASRIAIMRAEDPGGYVRAMFSILPKEYTVEAVSSGLSVEERLELIEKLKQYQAERSFAAAAGMPA
jgi:hypothetical protein